MEYVEGGAPLGAEIIFLELELRSVNACLDQLELLPADQVIRVRRRSHYLFQQLSDVLERDAMRMPIVACLSTQERNALTSLQLLLHRAYAASAPA
jgi:hypothetical protein